MSAGRIWSAEWRDYRDFRTGVGVRQLTDYKGHSHHLYFTNPGWHDGGRRLILASDRENRTNLFSLDLSSGEMLQLTELVPPDSPRLRPHFQQACLNPTREEGVLFTSDLSGYGNLYLVNLPEFDSLPPVSTKREFSMARAGLT